MDSLLKFAEKKMAPCEPFGVFKKLAETELTVCKCIPSISVTYTNQEPRYDSDGPITNLHTVSFVSANWADLIDTPSKWFQQIRFQYLKGVRGEQ